MRLSLALKVLMVVYGQPIEISALGLISLTSSGNHSVCWVHYAQLHVIQGISEIPLGFSSVNLFV